MDVKYAFLNGELQEEVYIEQSYGFQLTKKPNYVCKLKKDLYGLKKTARAWYSNLDKYLLKCGFKRATYERNLYVKEKDGKLTLVVVYMLMTLFFPMIQFF